jgi:predicted P-loop ATPase
MRRHEKAEGPATITRIVHPYDERGNDPCDFLGDPTYLEKLAAAESAGNVDRTLWRRHLQRTASGEALRAKGRDGGYAGNLYNCMLALEQSPELAGVVGFDEFANRLEALKPTPWDKDAPRRWSDRDDVELQRWLQRQQIPVQGLNTVGDAVRAAALRFDPLRDYLSSLRWDGTERLTGWLTTYMGAPESAFVNAVSRAWCISAVARGLEPGCQADHVLTLEGPQGAGKSTAARILGGPFTQEHLSDLGNKDAVAELAGSWIVEISELAAMGKSEAESIKAFISRRVDRYRPSYGRHVVEQLRRCVFLATTNEDRYLRDTTGNRRFWPVSVERLDVDALTRDRDQLWAEAVTAYHAGEPWHLTDVDTVSLAETEQALRVEIDPWADVIAPHLYGRDITTSRALLDVLNVPEDRRAGGHAKRLGGIMRQLGWGAPAREAGRPGACCTVRADDPADTPYLTAEQAVRAAYGSEVALAHGSSRLARICGGHGGYRNSHWQPLEPIEHIAQAAICLSLIRRAVSADALLMLDSAFTFEETAALCERKNRACRLLAERIAKAVRCPDNYVLAQVQKLVDGKVEVAEDSEWAKALGKTGRTLQYWRNGRDPRPGIVPMFKQYMAEALNEVEEALIAAGLMFR